MSPSSIRLAFAMVYQGAKGDTAREMASAFHFPEDVRSTAIGAGESLKALNEYGVIEIPKGSNPHVQVRPGTINLRVSNRLWLQSGLIPESSFVDTLRTHFSASVEALDFAHHANDGILAINRWSDEASNHFLPALVNARDVNTATQMVLASVVYFRGVWSAPFPGSVKKPFHISPGKSVDVDLMIRRSMSFRYYEDSSVQIVELPYGTGEISMIVVLPRQQDGLSEFEQAWDEARWQRWMDGLEKGQHGVVVQLPRFQAESNLQLQRALEGLGVRKAFLAGQGDFFRTQRQNSSHFVRRSEDQDRYRRDGNDSCGRQQRNDPTKLGRRATRIPCRSPVCLRNSRHANPRNSFHG